MLDPLFAQELVDELGDLANHRCTKTVAIRTHEVAVRRDHVVADQARARATIELGLDSLDVANHRRAQLRRDGAGWIGISEQFAEQQLASDDRSAGPVASDAAPPQALVRRGRPIKALGQRDPTRTMGGLFTSIKEQRLAADRSTPSHAFAAHHPSVAWSLFLRASTAQSPSPPVEALGYLR